jgi:guanine deaminase
MSILNVIQNANIAARIYSMKENGAIDINEMNVSESDDGTFADKKLSIATLLYLATLGGAEVCNIDKQVGSFAVGKSFDALLVNIGKSSKNPNVWEVDEAGIQGREGIEAALQKFMLAGDDRNISRVYVQGRVIGGTELTEHAPVNPVSHKN